MKKNNKCKILSTLLAAQCCFWRKRDAIKNNLEGGGGGPNVPPNQMLLPIPCCFYMFYVVEEGFYAKKHNMESGTGRSDAEIQRQGQRSFHFQLPRTISDTEMTAVDWT